MIFAAWRAARTGAAELRRHKLAGLAWLVPAFAVLAAVAIGPAPMWRGHPLLVLPLPGGWRDALDAVRASGRLVWPITSALAYAVVAIACRQPRATLLLAAALAFQMIDLTPMIAAVRATSARADDPRPFVRTRSPAWAPLIAGAGSIAFEPPENFRDLQVMEEVAWRAIGACRPLRFFYASRMKRETVLRLAAETRAFRAGRVDPARLYVVLDGRVPASLAPRAQHLDGVVLIPPAAPAPPPSCSR